LRCVYHKTERIKQGIDMNIEIALCCALFIATLKRSQCASSFLTVCKDHLLVEADWKKNEAREVEYVSTLPIPPMRKNVICITADTGISSTGLRLYTRVWVKKSPLMFHRCIYI